ncbi:MAG: Dephospho-CoA kinase [uncultured marine phage]|uniref:Dephospho-CoA kinase n=1 Tax=uncultured marine phage TaxID=707152 RepID=A0A8D9FS60_9VIRU|nr:MAG: Dephospho-CoA kinase [uncultured marine phage]
MVVQFKNTPKTIALTGPRMSGKDKVCKKFLKLNNIPTFDADLAFKFILNYDEEVRNKAKRFFGDNSFFGMYINNAFFDSDRKIQKLLEIAEEKVFESFHRWRKKQNTKYVIFMFAGIFEFPFNMKNFHSIINVFAPIDVRQMRVQYALGEDMDHILDDEYSPEKKNVRSDYIIHNYDGLNLESQVYNVHNKIIKQIS